MLQFVVRRLLLLVPILLGLSILLFLWVRALPGDPSTALLGERATAESIEQVREQYGLDRPIYVQYLAYMRPRRLRGQPRDEHPVTPAGHRGDLAPVPRDGRAGGCRTDLRRRVRDTTGVLLRETLRRALRPREPGRVAPRNLDPDLLPRRSCKWIFSVELGLFPTIGRQSRDKHRPPDELLRARCDHHPRPGRVRGLDLASRPARHRARIDPARDHRAHHTRVRARRPERGLRANGPGEGARVADRRPPPRLPERDASRGHDHRPADRVTPLRRDPDRDRLRHPRHGIVARRCDQLRRLPGPAGRDPVRGGHLRPREPRSWTSPTPSSTRGCG